MKTIGFVDAAFTDDSIYANGSIVMLSRREVETLKMLSGVWDGKIFRWIPMGDDKIDTEMSDVFKAIRCFIEAKLAVNELRAAANRLDGFLMKETEK